MKIFYIALLAIILLSLCSCYVSQVYMVEKGDSDNFDIRSHDYIVYKDSLLTVKMSSLVSDSPKDRITHIVNVRLSKGSRLFIKDLDISIIDQSNKELLESSSYIVTPYGRYDNTRFIELPDSSHYNSNKSSYFAIISYYPGQVILSNSVLTLCCNAEIYVNNKRVLLNKQLRVHKETSVGFSLSD